MIVGDVAVPRAFKRRTECAAVNSAISVLFDTWRRYSEVDVAGATMGICHARAIEYGLIDDQPVIEKVE